MKKSDCSLETAAEQWLKSRKSEVKESTLSNYRYYLEHYIFPELRGCPLSEVDTDTLQEYILKLEERWIGPSTIRKTLLILRMVLQYAGLQGCKVAGYKEIRVMNRNRRRISSLTEEEQARLLAYLSGEDCPLRREVRTGFILSLFAGLRIGEVCALKWKNLDLKRGVISVEKTLSRIYYADAWEGADRVKKRRKRTRIEISSPKTENSRREIPLPVFLQEYLRNEQRERYVCPDFYVLTSMPRPMEPRTYSYHFRKVRQDLDIMHCNYHMLRHTFATKCVEAGFDMKTLAEILGHANVSTTLNLYAHPTLQMKRNYMEKLADAYGL